MTPAVKELKKTKTAFVLHEYDHDPSVRSYGEEAAEKLDLSGGRIFKTLIIELSSGELAAAVIPVSSKLNLKLAAKACGVKKVKLAPSGVVERVTGYVLGGVSPVGGKKKLKTFIDNQALSYKSIYVSGGRRGLDIEIDPDDLKRLTGAEISELCSG